MKHIWKQYLFKRKLTVICVNNRENWALRDSVNIAKSDMLTLARILLVDVQIITVESMKLSRQWKLNNQPIKISEVLQEKHFALEKINICGWAHDQYS